jgi:hypothetical protein
MTTQKNPRKRSPAKFDGRAKVVTGAAAVVALLGGWNAIGHLENGAQAAAGGAGSALPAALPAALQGKGQRVQTGATLASLGIAPVATLSALPQVLAQGNPAVDTAGGGQANAALPPPSLPTLQALPELPTLQALPELPTLPAQPPPPPSASSARSGGS